MIKNAGVHLSLSQLLCGIRHGLSDINVDMVVSEDQANDKRL